MRGLPSPAVPTLPRESGFLRNFRPGAGRDLHSISRRLSVCGANPGASGMSLCVIYSA
jgi:hypothetical protein